jgi:hypothetical protein
MRSFFPALAAVVVAAGASACSRNSPDAPGIATPSMSLFSSDVGMGAPIEMTYRFQVADDAPALDDDTWVFSHFVDADGEQLWTDDHRPPVPPDQWKPGSTVQYLRTIFTPRQLLYVGEVRVEVGLYSRGTGQRLVLGGEDNGMRAYRVASFNMRMPTDPAVVFEQGWHDAEGRAPAVEPEWRWSQKTATLSFPNPKRDAVFFLEIDEPIQLPTMRHVEVRLGPSVIDSFPLVPERREVRRVPISTAQLGADPAVAITIGVDQTFVPHAIPQLKSADRRELGIRVFRAYVRPA